MFITSQRGRFCFPLLSNAFIPSLEKSADTTYTKLEFGNFLLWP